MILRKLHAYLWLFMSFANFTTAGLNWQLGNNVWVIFNTIVAVICIFVFARIITNVGEPDDSNYRKRDTDADS